MQTFKVLKTLSSSLLIAAVAASAHAEVTKEQQKLLGTTLTPMGANPNANADGSIPAWTGKIRGVPEGVKYDGPGSVYPDPYANEKPLFTITAANVDKYKDKLSDGMQALFKKYPDSYKMHIYPSHRDFRYKDQIEQRTKWNVGNAKLVGGLDGLQQFTGGAPFPIPKTGGEVIWNARINQPMYAADSMSDEIAVLGAKGKQQRYRNRLLIESPYGYTTHPVGTVAEDIGDIVAYVFYEVLEPKRKKGEMAIVHEPLNQVKFDRKAWVYLPGPRRVKRAPDVGYDTPIGPGGMMTVDDSAGFSGAMDRYDWKLIGKQEMYIPFHSYRFDDPKVKYKELLPGKHVNPEHVRYELQRVWVVEATLKANARHVYAKRRFYIAEDSWLIAATDAYDGRGELWRVGLLNSLYDFFLQGYVLRTHVKYDLLAGDYVAIGLVNETRPTNYDMKPLGVDYYSPTNLRKLGR